MNNPYNNMTDADIIKLVEFAQSRPTFYSFDKACFIVARATDNTVAYVQQLCKRDFVIDALIEEAMRVPQLKTQRQPTTGEVIIF